MLLQSRGSTLGTILEARNVIEPTMAAYAAQRRTDEHVARLNALVEGLFATIADSTKFHEINREFHDVVAEASGNQLLAVLMPSLSWMSAAIGWELPQRVRKRVAEDKSLIADAIEQRDPHLAADRMRRMVMAVDRTGPRFLDRPVIWADVDELLDEHLRQGNDASGGPARRMVKHSSYVPSKGAAAQ
jgi:DNA-binding FadR family transcriptional regulator